MNRGKFAIIKLSIVAMGTIAKTDLGWRICTVDVGNYDVCARLRTYENRSCILH